MKAHAVVIDEPGRLDVRPVALKAPGPSDAVVRVSRTGVSTGTERLLWTGRMPPFPGLGYPLVPGYEAIGTVVQAGPDSGRKEGDEVFVPGATCYSDVRGLFGAAAHTLVVPGARILPMTPGTGDEGCLLALAATAFHVLQGLDHPPDLIVGHGALGRLLARLVVRLFDTPLTVWETNPLRKSGARGYTVLAPEEDPRRDYASAVDASGDPLILDAVVPHLTRHGLVTLAGFYDRPVSFQFPPAFLREARVHVSAEWKPEDLVAVGSLVMIGELSLDGLVTHRLPADRAAEAYPVAFEDPGCVKMTLDWSTLP